MNRRLATVLAGAAIGACVGALYAWAYLEYRQGVTGAFERLDAAQDLPQEETAQERKQQAQLRYQERMAQARAYREQNPGTSWPEAMRRARLAARNGGGEVTEDVPAS